MVGEWITDKLSNRGLFTKTPSEGSSEDLTSGYSNDAEILPEEIPSKRYFKEPGKDVDMVNYPFGRSPPETDFKAISDKENVDEIRPSGITTNMDTSDIPEIPSEIPKVEIPKTDIPKDSTQETPKAETPQSEAPKVPETEIPVMPKAAEIVKPEGPGLVKQTLDYFGKRLPTKEELKESGKSGIMGTPSGNDMEYARRGGYVGIPKETLISTNDILSKRNTTLQSDIERINSDLITLASDRKELYDKLKATKDTADRAELNNELKRLDSEITKLEMRKQQIMTKIGENEDAIRKYNISIAQYEEAVRVGRAKASVRGVVGKKLQALGEGAGEVSSGVYDKTRVSRDWFGQKGFLAQPFKQANITSSVVQPVRTRMANLDAITRSTGSIVGRGMVDAVTTVRANKNISPFGTPGTIAGAKQQFEYNVPARKIVAADVKTSINPDIMPNIFSPKVQAPVVQQYTQVMQPDGTIINVPMQQRQSKSIVMLVNRGVKHSVKPYNKNVNVGNIDVFKMQPIAKVKVGAGLDISQNKLKRGEAVKVTMKKPTFDLNLITSKNIGIEAYEIKSAKKTDRKQKQSENVTSLLNVGKNLNKLVSGKKVKKV